MRVDDSDVLKKYIGEQITELKTELTDKLKGFNVSTIRKFEKITGENLLIPNIIGPEGTGCPFKNMKEWVLNTEAKGLELKVEIVDEVSKNFSEELIKDKKVGYKRFTDLKTVVEGVEARSKEDSKNLNSSIKVNIDR